MRLVTQNVAFVLAIHICEAGAKVVGEIKGCRCKESGRSYAKLS